MFSRKIRYLALPIAALLAACGGEGSSGVAGQAAGNNIAELEGTTWELAELTVLGGHVFRPENPADYTIRFLSDSRVRGQSDCNTYTGNWSGAAPFTLTGISSTRSLCLTGSLHNYYLLYLRDVVDLQLQDQSLIFTTSDADVRIAFQKAG